ncbi:MAG: ABC transporter substrate-binding protein [Micromonosporaceae bacterium]|nr:ABC transporter substrate-binding protein [Micromonosporaceae bacterium]
MRVVSLVPSLTEAVALTLPGALVGATRWCTHPAELDVPRVGGPKDPDLAAIRDLAPDLVVMSVEENRRVDAEALRAAGTSVYAVHPQDIDSALTMLADLVGQLGVRLEPSWLSEARAAWARLPAVRKPKTPVKRGLVPVWREPWIVAAGGTVAADVLRRLGVADVVPSGPVPAYPAMPLEALRALSPEMVVFPDEPYYFTATDGPEAFWGLPCYLVSGRHLFWYGPSLAQAPRILAEQLAQPVMPQG